MRTLQILFAAVALVLVVLEGSKVREQAREISKEELAIHNWRMGGLDAQIALEELGQGADPDDIYDRALEIRMERWGY